MKFKKMLKICMAAAVLLSVFAFTSQKAAAAATITDESSQEVTEITPVNANETGDPAVYTVTLATGTDNKKSIPVIVKSPGKLMVNLLGTAVTKGVKVCLYTLEDCSDGSKIGYGESLYESAAEKIYTVDISKAGTYYLCFETSDYTSESTPAETQIVSFQAMTISAGGILTSGKAVYGTNLGSGYSYYKVTAPKTGYYTVELENTGEYDYSFNVTICNSKKKAYDTSGEYVSSSEQVKKTIFAVKKGTYYIAVKTSNTAYLVKQTFKGAPDNGGVSKAKAVTIAKGKTKQGIFAVNDSKTATDWYKFKITKSQKVGMTFKGSTTLNDIKLEVFSGSSSIGTRRLSGIDSDASFSIFTYGNNDKLRPGTYYIKVSKDGNSSANGYYSLKFN